MTAPPVQQIISLAPKFGIGVIPFAGHEETYQLGLARAATRDGISWSILAPHAAKVSDPTVVRALDVTDSTSVVESLKRHLEHRTQAHERSTGVVVYEGDTGLAVALTEVATDHPDVQFLVNLFLAEVGLDAPLVRRKRYPTQQEVSAYGPDRLRETLAPIAGVEWPTNMMLTAETDAKLLLARSVGLPVVDTWRLHSAIAERADRGPLVTNPRPSGRLRVLIAVRSSQMHPPLVDDIVEVIDRVSRVEAGRAIEWRMTGRFDESPRVRTALRRLTDAGVILDAHRVPLSDDAYERVFVDVDVVWMPTTWPYRVQSSGKALDALVVGRPVVAPAGTAAADAMRRWIPGAPTYGSLSEAAQVFLRMPTMSALMCAELEVQRAEIRATYRPDSTVRWVIGLLQRSEAQAVKDAPTFTSPEPSSGGTPVGPVGMLADHQSRDRLRLLRSGLAVLRSGFRAFGRAVQERR